MSCMSSLMVVLMWGSVGFLMHIAMSVMQGQRAGVCNARAYCVLGQAYAA